MPDTTPTLDIAAIEAVLSRHMQAGTAGMHHAAKAVHALFVETLDGAVTTALGAITDDRLTPELLAVIDRNVDDWTARKVEEGARLWAETYTEENGQKLALQAVDYALKHALAGGRTVATVDVGPLAAVLKAMEPPIYRIPALDDMAPEDRAKLAATLARVQTGGSMALILEAAPASADEVDDLWIALADLVGEVETNTCHHEDTVRGGTLWTICQDCGRKWADDQGGFQPYKDSPPLARAKAVLARNSAPATDQDTMPAVDLSVPEQAETAMLEWIEQWASASSPVAKYGVLSSYLAGKVTDALSATPLSQAPAGEERPLYTEAEMDEVLRERDHATDWADRLATAIGGEEIGEHSFSTLTGENNPWANALELIEVRGMAPAGQGVGLEELRAALQAQHDWHLSQTDEDQYGIVPAEAYSESSLCDRTSLALRDAAQPTQDDATALCYVLQILGADLEPAERETHGPLAWLAAAVDALRDSDVRGIAEGDDPDAYSTMLFEVDLLRDKLATLLQASPRAVFSDMDGIDGAARASAHVEAAMLELPADAERAMDTRTFGDGGGVVLGWSGRRLVAFGLCARDNANHTVTVLWPTPMGQPEQEGADAPQA